MLPGGVIRALAGTTGDRRVITGLLVVKVKRYRRGCRGARSDRPAPDMGEPTARHVEIIFQPCAQPHDTGWASDGTYLATASIPLQR